jgi:RNA-binding protein
MKYAHNVDARVFCKEGEDEEKITSKIGELFPFDFEKEKIKINSQSAEVFEDKKIKIISVHIEKERHTTKFLDSFFGRLDKEQKKLLLSQLESRLDERLHLYIRLEKDRLLEGKYELTDSGNCFHIKITIAAYPHKRDVAREIIKVLLDTAKT